MTDEEKRLFKEMVPRMVEGWKMAEMDRYRGLKHIGKGHREVLSLTEMFEVLLKVPRSETRGLEAYYAALAKSR